MGSQAEVGYPFSAVVGHDRLRLALILCAVHPGIGGVLVRGEKGTAKSTVVRAFASLLPPVDDGDEPRAARMVELPVGATEDRVIGSLDLEKMLLGGEHAFRPGLLAAAHHGVLYVDEVNLLHDHLVDVLLDAAAMGRVHVERDGVSHSHPARFLLVGTMNPEEGELRPQLLDRFGLTVDVSASRDVDVRMEVIRRRLDYERDPAAFAARFADEDAEIARRIVQARAALDSIKLDDTELRRIAALCAAFDVDGMRADLVVARAATAHAAWRGADAVTADDVRVGAELALPHRRRRDPFDEPGLDQQQLDDAMNAAEDEARAAGDTPDPEDAPPEPDPSGPDGGGGEKPHSGSGNGVASYAPASRPRRLEVPGVGSGAPGRRSRAQAGHGRIISSTKDTRDGVHVLATITEAARRGPRRGRLAFAPSDLRGAVKEGREANLVIFVVDASGSMAARDRLAAVTGAVVALLRDAYQRRDKVAVITVRGHEATLVLPPTSSVDIAVRRLTNLRTGGKTPLAEGFLRARQVVLAERVRDPNRRALVVALTDGRATGSQDAVHRAKVAAGLLARMDVGSVVVDCERGMVRLGLAVDLARALGGEYLRLAELSADSVAGAVRAA
ncbi:VWA domain-containing protein [Skermania sp. ID1734]|uniref:ATP-binding protein n=1 Tax=Skermania sp. ID1734 TaxID=2597516 RepID=UPI00117C9361|nr:ATP-binding protein [Skermania sp. ID1734]TSD93553.1 VWA domain-containing protein [Skermania sp. ID1734]